MEFRSGKHLIVGDLMGKDPRSHL